MPPSAERQSGTGTEIRLQAALVRKADGLRQSPLGERLAGPVGDNAGAFLGPSIQPILVWRRRLPRSCGPVRSVPAIAVAGSTRRRSLLEAAEQNALALGETGLAGPKSRSSGSIGSRGCQGPLDVGSGSGQALRSGRVLRSLRRCVCTASEEVRGAIGLRHGVDLRSTRREPNGSSKCRYRGSGLHMVIAPRAREASVQISLQFDRSRTVDSAAQDVQAARSMRRAAASRKDALGTEIRGHQRRLIRRIRRHWPQTRITIRGRPPCCTDQLG